MLLTSLERRAVPGGGGLVWKWTTIVMTRRAVPMIVVQHACLGSVD